jgi:hypothetical protein
VYICTEVKFDTSWSSPGSDIHVETNFGMLSNKKRNKAPVRVISSGHSLPTFFFGLCTADGVHIFFHVN